MIPKEECFYVVVQNQEMKWTEKMRSDLLAKQQDVLITHDFRSS